MPELMKNDDKAIRSYILKEVFEKTPIDESYENLCKVIGSDSFAFYDFQFWYYRFLSGNQDLDFDRSSEPEPLQFTDLPVDAVGLILDKLEVVERLMLRRVSKSLQEFIEKQVFDCTHIEVSFGDNLVSWGYQDGFITVRYGKGHILYTKDYSYKKESEIGETPVIYGDESEICDDLACFLKNPKLQLTHLTFSKMLSCPQDGVLSNLCDKLKSALKSMEHQISVKKLFLRPEHPDNLLTILPHLKPGYLETITINCKGTEGDWRSGGELRKFEQIVELDQWIQAEELILQESLYLFPDDVLSQFKKYRIRVPWLDEKLAHIGSKFAASPVFENCFFKLSNKDEDASLDSIGVPGPAAEEYRSVRHLMIPNTDKMLVFKEVSTKKIEIEKKTRDVQ